MGLNVTMPMYRVAKRISRRLGATQLIKRTLNHLAGNPMRFPTFSKSVHNVLICRSDYFRCATMALGVQRLQTENIPGCFAEAGVYRGDTAAYIHKLAPNRTYYLFDTFQGFAEQDLPPGPTGKRFDDTSVDIVLKNVGDTSNVVVRAGHVPATLEGLEHIGFAFVLLDLDLYEPTLRSLQFFYPRLSRGGYLIVHDYNNIESDHGCQRALDEFMQDKPELMVELADNWGSIMFRRL